MFFKKSFRNLLSEFHHSSEKDRILKKMETLLRKGADVNERFKTDRDEGVTPLHLAAKHPNLSSYLCEFLVRNGASVNARTMDMDTPLSWAEAPAILTLINNGANLEQVDKYGKNALHVLFKRADISDAAKTGSYYENELQVSKVLVDKGCDINSRYPCPPFFSLPRTVERYTLSYCDDDGERIVEVNDMRNFQHAAENKLVDFFKSLENIGLDLKAEDEEGNSFLMVTLCGPLGDVDFNDAGSLEWKKDFTENEFPFLKYLISSSDINKQNNDGNTVLMLLADAYTGKYCKFSYIWFLIKQCSNLNFSTRNNDGKTARDIFQGNKLFKDSLPDKYYFETLESMI